MHEPDTVAKLIKAHSCLGSLDELVNWCERRVRLYESAGTGDSEPHWMRNQKKELVAIVKGLVNSSLVDDKVRARAEIMRGRLRSLGIEVEG